MISNKIKIFADPSFQGGEAGPPDQMYKDQHPLHGAQLCQVGGSFFFLIWSFSSNKVHGWVLPPCWAPWGENFRSSDLLIICATCKKDNWCHLQKNRTIFILNIIQLTDLVFMGNPLEEELSEAEDYNNRVVRSLQMFIWKWLDSGKCCQFTGVQHLPTSEMTMLAKLMMYSDPDMS